VNGSRKNARRLRKNWRKRRRTNDTERGMGIVGNMVTDAQNGTVYFCAEAVAGVGGEPKGRDDSLIMIGGAEPPPQMSLEN
jgi:hypothetical protein